MHRSLDMKNTTTAHRCECGKRIGRYARECRECFKAKMDRIHVEAQAIVATSRCPRCGAPLRRNLALAGWWECAQRGAPGFRADAGRPSCDFQVFTE